MTCLKDIHFDLFRGTNQRIHCYAENATMLYHIEFNVNIMTCYQLNVMSIATIC
jgi:hypothetical protein